MHAATERDARVTTGSMPWLRDEDIRLTAADLRDAGRPRTGWPRRGYDPDAVDALIRHAARELDTMAAHNANLLAEVARLRQRFIHTAGDADPGAWPPNLGDAHEVAADIVSAGQLVVDREIRAAREQATAIMTAARQGREQVLGDADTMADQIEPASNAR